MTVATDGAAVDAYAAALELKAAADARLAGADALAAVTCELPRTLRWAARRIEAFLRGNGSARLERSFALLEAVVAYYTRVVPAEFWEAAERRGGTLLVDDLLVAVAIAAAGEGA